MKFTEYTVVTANTPLMLAMDVNDMIEAGWQPIGGVCFDRYSLMQAMGRPDSGPPNPPPVPA